MNKNETVRLLITGMTSEGMGVGRYDGMAVFVPFTAVGDEIDAKILKAARTHCYAKIEKMISPSADRAEPDCEVFGKCGGCVFRHLSYEAQLKVKASRITDAFSRIGGISPEFMGVCANDMPLRYRNKAQYPVGSDRQGNIVSGFFAGRSHRIIPCRECMLEDPVFADIRHFFEELCAEYSLVPYDETTRTGLVRHLCIRKGHYSRETSVVIVAAHNDSRFSELAARISGQFPQVTGVSLNINPDDTNVIYGKEMIPLCGRPEIYDTMLGKKFMISPLSFYQVNTPMAEKLYAYAAELAEPDGKTLIDLYCGTGTIGLTMADRAKSVIGADIVPEAIENAKVNASLNGISSARFYCGDASAVTRTLREQGTKADVVIVDPARKGCGEEALRNICSFGAQRIVMISCDPATAARDCARLRELGYTALSVKGFDLFTGTAHVESAVLLKRTDDQ